MGTTAIITTCTSKKLWPAPDFLRARSLPAGSTGVVAAEWGERLRRAGKQAKLLDLYRGRSFQYARDVARARGSEFFVLSAGLGLRHATDFGPAYSLTVAKGDVDSIGRLITSKSRICDAWWRALYQEKVSSVSLAEIANDSDLSVIAAPTSYLDLIEAELLAMPSSIRSKVRIVGPRARDDRAEAVSALVLPYDGRLDGTDSAYRGTNSDFPQRALRHFFADVLPQCSCSALSEHHRAVVEALSLMKAPIRVVGQRLSDAELQKTVFLALDNSGGRVARALRALRKDMGIACEQKRFAQFAALWKDKNKS